MPLLSLTNVSLAFGTYVLFDKIDLTVHRGQRTGILGRNGAGKSTFMKMLDGQHIPDSGKLWIRPGIKVGYLTQDLPDANEATVYDVVSDGLAEVGALLKEYHHLIMGEFDEASMTNSHVYRISLKLKMAGVLAKRSTLLSKRLIYPLIHR